MSVKVGCPFLKLSMDKSLLMPWVQIFPRGNSPMHPIISVGENNVHDMRHENVMKFLSERIIKNPNRILITRDHGLVIITIDGSGKLEIIREKQ
jgi:beta-lactamase superfamily II metal-dependent hydrolase